MAHYQRSDRERESNNMSVYNFNDNEHATVNNHQSGQSVGKGIHPMGYHHIENEFLNRTFHQQSNHGESSVQHTRLTSKTALLVRQRRAMLEQLSCSICKGYLIDATTVVECMDSFCKSCIAKHLRANNDCPKCGMVLQYRNPYEALRADKVLQEIVYKLVPGLFDDEMRRRREFYKQYYGAISSASSEDDDGSSTGSLTVQGSSLRGEKYGVISDPKPFYKPSDNIDLSIEPQARGENATIYYDNKRQSIVTCFTGNLQRDVQDDGFSFSAVDSQLFKTYLRCPARLTVLQLKKFIAAKFNICPGDTIHLKYLNESLKDEYSLMDVVYIYDWRSLEHMQLLYVIERDLSKVSISNGHSADSNRRSGKSTRHSVGTSTQTIKRVCIDPQPKFYQEKNNNEIDVVNSEGRSMRPRIDKTVNVGKSSQVTHTNPIIKASRDYGNPTLSNGISTREQASKNNGVSNARQHQQPSKSGKVGELNQTRVAAMNSTKPPTGSSTAKPNIVHTNSNQPSNNVYNIDPSRISQKAVNNIAPSQIAGQVAPHTGSNYPTLASASPCSVMTMESFVESRNVVTTLSSTPNVSSTYLNTFNRASGSGARDGPVSRYDTTPKLAFTIVTERGVTIVRHNRLNNQQETPPSHSDQVRLDQLSRPNELTAPNQHRFESTSTTRPATYQAESQASSSRTVPEDTVSPRHQIKVKPIYKTLVDPTKLKTPNLKKLGFTARH